MKALTRAQIILTVLFIPPIVMISTIFLLKENTPKPPKPIKFDQIVEHTHNGHDYIYFTRIESAGIVHDPDCPCQTPQIK